jgi:very-short-patch-repair endonuclease
VLPLVDAGAESPQETRARLVLIDAGLPPPRTQFRVFDEHGQFVARLDMAYDEVKVGIEYDGSQHWTDPAVRQRDIDKQFALTELGWLIVRVSRDLLRYRRATYVARVATALHSRNFRV